MSGFATTSSSSAPSAARRFFAPRITPSAIESRKVTSERSSMTRVGVAVDDAASRSRSSGAEWRSTSPATIDDRDPGSDVVDVDAELVVVRPRDPRARSYRRPCTRMPLARNLSRVERRDRQAPSRARRSKYRARTDVHATVCPLPPSPNGGMRDRPQDYCRARVATFELERIDSAQTHVRSWRWWRTRPDCRDDLEEQLEGWPGFQARLDLNRVTSSTALRCTASSDSPANAMRRWRSSSSRRRRSPRPSPSSSSAARRRSRRLSTRRSPAGFDRGLKLGAVLPLRCIGSRSSGQWRDRRRRGRRARRVRGARSRHRRSTRPRASDRGRRRSHAVSFMDSTALGVIVRGVRASSTSGRGRQVVLPAGSARRIFEITALDRVLPDRSDARRRARSARGLTLAASVAGRRGASSCGRPSRARPRPARTSSSSTTARMIDMPMPLSSGPVIGSALVVGSRCPLPWSSTIISIASAADDVRRRTTSPCPSG